MDKSNLSLVRLSERVEIVKDNLGPISAASGIWQIDDLRRRFGNEIVQFLQTRSIIQFI